MHVAVRPAEDTRLTLLPEIPHLQPCLIEGRNGIGKTLTVRLLELISGRQPFDNSERQWHSLRERLGRATVTVRELADARVLVFTFTPDCWPTEGDAPLAFDAWLGDAWLDDKPIAVREAQRVLWVERIAGNEDLGETARKRLELYSNRAQRTAQRVDAAAGLIDLLLAPVLDEIRDADPERLAVERTKLGEAENAETDARQALEAGVERHERILNAIDARDRLNAATDANEEWQRRTRELAARLANLEGEQAGLEKTIEQATVQLRRHGAVDDALAEAQSRQRYRLKRQRNIAADIEWIARALGIEATPENLKQQRDEAEPRLADLEQQRNAIDAAGSTARLVDRVSGVVEGGIADGLGEQDLIAQTEGNLSVDEVSDGLTRRAEELADVPAPDELRGIARDLQRQRVRVARLRELAARLRDADRQAELVREADDEVETAERRVDAAGGQDQALKDANRSLAAVEEEADRVAAEQADLNARLGMEGGRSAQDAEDDLQRAVEEFELGGPGELDTVEPDTRTEVIRLEGAHGAATDLAGALRRSVALLSASIETTIATLLSDERMRWLLRAETVIDELREEATGVETFGWLRRELLRIDERIQGARRLPETLSDVAKHALREQAIESPLTEPLRVLLGNELREAFDRPAIRKYLFDGADIVMVDAFNEELVLEEPDGSRATRPFDTFSTGEQAFAFTQARVLELERSARPNRLLVLDEFGAFVAADRMPELADFLGGEDVAPIADQVLVILPMQTEYEQELENTQGELHERYAERATQIKARGYCAVRFEP